uniref:hypothetical protein n=1 Tax=Streptococcus pluranimalium TaxID=82348 RepID=UPI003F6921F7
MTYYEQQQQFYQFIETASNAIALFVLLVAAFFMLRALLRNRFIFKLIKFFVLIIPVLILSAIEIIKH